MVQYCPYLYISCTCIYIQPVLHFIVSYTSCVSVDDFFVFIPCRRQFHNNFLTIVFVHLKVWYILNKIYLVNFKIFLNLRCRLEDQSTHIMAIFLFYMFVCTLTVFTRFKLRKSWLRDNCEIGQLII